MVTLIMQTNLKGCQDDRKLLDDVGLIVEERNEFGLTEVRARDERKGQALLPEEESCGRYKATRQGTI